MWALFEIELGYLKKGYFTPLCVASGYLFEKMFLLRFMYNTTSNLLGYARRVISS